MSMNVTSPTSRRRRVPRLRTWFGAIGSPVAAAAAMVCLMAGLAYAFWALSGAGRSEGLSPAFPTVRPDLNAPVPHAAQWTGPREFQEAPDLAARVARGELPPVERRLPEDPLVIVPPEQFGPYGGTWEQFTDRVNQIPILQYYICCDSLLRFRPLADGVEPNLAADMPLIEDGGRSFTFRLRRGVRWSDGEPFTADDIMFWYRDVLQDPELTPIIPQRWRHGGRLFDLDKLDDYTIRFRFAQPNGLFLYFMANPALVGVGGAEMPYDFVSYPAHYLRQFHARYTDKDRLEQLAAEQGLAKWYQFFARQASWQNPDMPTLSPWMIAVRPTVNKPVEFVRNPYYWKVDPEGRQLPYIDRITYEVFDPEVINFKIIAGQGAFQQRYLRPENYPLYAANGPQRGYHMLHWIGSHGNGYVLAFNLNHKDPVLRSIFNDVRFRQAMSLAIDRREMIEVGGGGGVPRQVCPPSASPFFDPQYALAYTEYAPDRACALLDEMGLRRGADGIRLRPDGKPLLVRLETCRDSKLHELVCEYFTAVGVKTELKFENRDLFYERKAALLHDLAMWVGADEYLPMLDGRWFVPTSDESLHAIGWARWFSGSTDGTPRKGAQEPPPEVKRCMELYRKLTQTVDFDEQKRLFKEIIDLNRQYLWVIGVSGEGEGLVLVSDSLHNVPGVGLIGSAVRMPGPAAPECWAIGTAAPRRTGGD